MSSHVGSSALLRKLSSSRVDQVNFLQSVKIVITLRNGGAVESVGLDNISTALQVGHVNSLNHVRTSDNKHIIVALELRLVISIPLTTEILLLKLVLLNLSTHSTINEDNTLTHQSIKLFKSFSLAKSIIIRLIYW